MEERKCTECSCENYLNKGSFGCDCECHCPAHAPMEETKTYCACGGLLTKYKEVHFGDCPFRPTDLKEKIAKLEPPIEVKGFQYKNGYEQAVKDILDLLG